MIRTTPGAAQLIARLLDSFRAREGILGTIAGDDTIFVAPRETDQIDDMVHELQEVFGQE